MKVGVKICGIKDKASLDTAIEVGARYVGFVFVPESPRFIEPAMVAQLARHVPMSVKTVGLFVNPTDEILDAALSATSIEYIQLHGTESVARVQEIKEKFLCPIIKAFPVATREDIEQYHSYEDVIDIALFDAKPSPQELANNMTGGSGKVFDWSLFTACQITIPWMLAGGISEQNFRKALEVTNAPNLDISSSVEETRGEKSPRLIKSFMRAVHAYEQENAARELK